MVSNCRTERDSLVMVSLMASWKEGGGMVTLALERFLFPAPHFSPSVKFTIKIRLVFLPLTRPTERNHQNGDHS